MEKNRLPEGVRPDKMVLRGRSGVSSAAVLLVIVALTGKLAFLTLSKTQLQSADGALSLLQVRARRVAEGAVRCRENQHRQHIPPRIHSFSISFASCSSIFSSPFPHILTAVLRRWD